MGLGITPARAARYDDKAPCSGERREAPRAAAPVGCRLRAPTTESEGIRKITATSPITYRRIGRRNSHRKALWVVYPRSTTDLGPESTAVGAAVALIRRTLFPHRKLSASHRCVNSTSWDSSISAMVRATERVRATARPLMLWAFADRSKNSRLDSGKMATRNVGRPSWS